MFRELPPPPPHKRPTIPARVPRPAKSTPVPLEKPAVTAEKLTRGPSLQGKQTLDRDRKEGRGHKDVARFPLVESAAAARVRERRTGRRTYAARKNAKRKSPRAQSAYPSSQQELRRSILLLARTERKQGARGRGNHDGDR